MKKTAKPKAERIFVFSCWCLPNSTFNWGTVPFQRTTSTWAWTWPGGGGQPLQILPVILKSQKLQFSERTGMHSSLKKLWLGQVSKGPGSKLKTKDNWHHLQTRTLELTWMSDLIHYLHWNESYPIQLQNLWIPRCFWLRGGVEARGNESESRRFLNRGF